MITRTHECTHTWTRKRQYTRGLTSGKYDRKIIYNNLSKSRILEELSVKVYLIINNILLK